ncbi:PilW family protein [Vibrio maerlii]|uniref:PilW family protein n=1 Tax=Vibrio maerlii TaxID=2231648 RepID=UPI000E3D89C9|nr:pilus assembly protein PilW [Vibrio maerlii]
MHCVKPPYLTKAQNLITLRNQSGASLFEMSVASLVGAVVLILVGTLFLSIQRSATERGKELLLQQNLFSTIQLLKEDLQRAGYNGVQGESLKLPGATHTIYVEDNGTNDGLIAYAYQIPTMSGGYEYRNVMYRQSDSTPTQIMYCESEQATLWNVSSLASVSGCSSLFAERQIRVSHFDVTQAAVSSDVVDSAFVTISLGAYLRYDNQIVHELTSTILQRNWQ